MKKTLLLLLVSLIFSYTFSQTTLGMKAGINRSHLSQERIPFGPKKGLNVGIFVTSNLGEKFWLRSEVLYSVKGFLFLNNSSDKISLDYVSFPLQISYKFLTSFQFSLGPQMSFLVAQRYTQSPSHIRKTDFSLTTDLNYIIIKRLGINLRYEYGLTKAYGYSEKFGYNRTVQFGLSYGLKKFSKAK